MKTFATRAIYGLLIGTIKVESRCDIQPDTAGNVVIPNDWADIQDEAFYQCDSILSVIIPANVKTIGNYAFDKSSLESINFGESSLLETIGEGAFSYTKITSVVIPATVRKIGDVGFTGTTLESIVFEEGSLLETIGENAFSMCPWITSVVLPANLRIIGMYGFYTSVRLKSITFGEGSLLESIGEQAFTQTQLESINIPKNVEIGENAFLRTGCGFDSEFFRAGNTVCNCFVESANVCPTSASDGGEL